MVEIPGEQLLQDEDDDDAYSLYGDHIRHNIVRRQASLLTVVCGFFVLVWFCCSGSNGTTDKESLLKDPGRAGFDGTEVGSLW